MNCISLPPPARAVLACAGTLLLLASPAWAASRLQGTTLLAQPDEFALLAAAHNGSGGGAAPRGISKSNVFISTIPVAGIPTEDVDMVEIPFGVPGVPPTIVYPTEAGISFINMTTETVYSVQPKLGANISGTDFYASPDGTIGVFPTLGYMNIYDLGPLPSMIAAIPLPGTPARRDIDPIFVPGIGSGPWDVIYATGTEVHRIDCSAAVILWTTSLLTPVVEAVDPVYDPYSTTGFPLVFVPTDGYMNILNALTGTPFFPPPSLGTTLIREVDARLNPAGTQVHLHANMNFFVFSALTGALLSATPLASPGIEGNDIEYDNSGTRGALITLSSMVWFNAGTGAITDIIPFPAGYTHQRNQDVIFTGPGVSPQNALYAMQGAACLYSVPALPAAVGLFAVTPTPGVTVDGVDPANTGKARLPSWPPGPSGTVALLPTLGFTSLIDMFSGAIVSMSTPGVLRMDVDARPGYPGNKTFQPYIGGVTVIAGFDPTQWTVTVSTGVYVVNAVSGTVTDFVPTGMIFRGGDAQVMGPPISDYSVDQVDQDFVTKCWEYKYALNRWPYWYANSYPFRYPYFLPYGVFGPPALMGWDILNNWKVMVCRNQVVCLLDERGVLRQTVNLPAPPIGGLIWDWDNKICKLRLRGQQELLLNLSTIPSSGSALVTYIPYLQRIHWYPIVDRMNGWEFVVQRGARRVWVYNHVHNAFVTYFDLPARIIRRPVFDEQRKTLCFPLANRTVGFFNSYIYASTGLVSSALYYSPALPRLVCADPVFDIYNHYTLCRLYGGSIVVLDNENGLVRYNTGLLPFWPVGPIQIDCYNKIAKWQCFNGANYGEYWMNLYPLAKGGPPVLNLYAFGAGLRMYGYPQYDSRDAYQWYRYVNGNTLFYQKMLFAPAGISSIVAPFALTGALHIDRINKYALHAMTTNRIWWLNMFRAEQALAGATQVISLPSPPTQDIHFVSQLHLAVVQLQSGQVAVIDMQAGTLKGIVASVPQCRRQIYVHPFRGLCNYPYYDTGTGAGYDVTIDVSPLRQSPPGSIYTRVEPLPQPTNEAANFINPLPLLAGLIQQLPHQMGDDPGSGVMHYRLLPGAGAPGLNYVVDNLSKRETDQMLDPVDGTLEEDGSDEVSVVAQPGEVICFKAFDPEGNASDSTCIVTTTVGVGPDGSQISFAFRITGSNPVRSRTSFHFSIPSRQRVELKIYDVSGRRLATVVERELDAGAYDQAWTLAGSSGGALPAGVYFARFKAGDYEETHRLAVLK